LYGIFILALKSDGVSSVFCLQYHQDKVEEGAKKFEQGAKKFGAKMNTWGGEALSKLSLFTKKVSFCAAYASETS